MLLEEVLFAFSFKLFASCFNSQLSAFRSELLAFRFLTHLHNRLCHFFPAVFFLFFHQAR